MKNSMSSNSQPDTQAELNFDAALAALQQSVKQMESGELTLEQSLKTFEEGVRLSRLCQAHLVAAEQKVELLMKGGGDQEGAPELQPFKKPSGT